MPVRLRSARIALFLVALLLGLRPAAAFAAVEISFYSKEFGSSFPHAFVALEGTVDATGEKIATNYGFTATHISPAILLGPVKGEVVAVGEKYVRNSDRHFSLILTDQEYRRVMEVVERWRTLKQPSYSLNRKNCVYFVAEVAAALGMKADTPKALMKKPRSYVQSLVKANSAWLEARRVQDENERDVAASLTAK